jgi:hypothetical protein
MGMSYPYPKLDTRPTPNLIGVRIEPYVETTFYHNKVHPVRNPFPYQTWLNGDLPLHTNLAAISKSHQDIPFVIADLVYVVNGTVHTYDQYEGTQISTLNAIPHNATIQLHLKTAYPPPPPDPIEDLADSFEHM